MGRVDSPTTLSRHKDLNRPSELVEPTPTPDDDNGRFEYDPDVTYETVTIGDRDEVDISDDHRRHKALLLFASCIQGVLCVEKALFCSGEHE